MDKVRRGSRVSGQCWNVVVQGGADCTEKKTTNAVVLREDEEGRKVILATRRMEAKGVGT